MSDKKETAVEQKDEIIFLCEQCGTSDIYFDASLVWAYEDQEFQIGQIDKDVATCNHCGDGQSTVAVKRVVKPILCEGG